MIQTKSYQCSTKENQRAFKEISKNESLNAQKKPFFKIFGFSQKQT